MLVIPDSDGTKPRLKISFFKSTLTKNIFLQAHFTSPLGESSVSAGHLKLACCPASKVNERGWEGGWEDGGF